jgi:LuxR family maltose regulon positive regulatory protein
LGDLSGAYEAIGKALQLGEEGRITELTVRQMQAHQARLWLSQPAGLRAAARWTETLRERGPEQDTGGKFALFVQGLEDRVRAQVYVALERYQEALALLASHRETLKAVGWTGIAIETMALQALALYGQGCVDEALDVLLDGLLLAQSEGYARVFVDRGPPMAELLNRIDSLLAAGEQPALGEQPAPDEQWAPGELVAGRDDLRAYVSGLLKAFADQSRRIVGAASKQVAGAQARPDASTGQPDEYFLDPLTNRERQVLHLLVAGLSNREIAQQLTITLGTAKRHVSNIYAKLGVHSRVQAVARAQTLHLV